MTTPRGVAVLGSTGSVGTNTLNVVRHLDGTHRIVALAAGKNAPVLMEQIREFRPRTDGERPKPNPEWSWKGEEIPWDERVAHPNRWIVATGNQHEHQARLGRRTQLAQAA